ncbi:MAG: 4Fe-4S binding protein [Peptococcaceae bacterium]|nr:4Fe-4S binding protein [Peptococcaceae bacterium]
MKKRLFFQAEKCMFCGNCELACATRDTGGDIVRLAGRTEWSSSRIRVEGSALSPEAFFCHSCEYPLCLEACIGGALELSDGRVVYNPGKCVACWSCVMACPFGAVKADPGKKAVVRCDGCGEWERPACAESCPTGALSFQSPSKYRQGRGNVLAAMLRPVAMAGEGFYKTKRG